MADVEQPLLLSVEADRRKAELYAAGGQRVYNLGNVVADNAEACGFGVSFDNSSQRRLCISGHTVSLVKDDELQLGNLPATRVPRDLPLGEFLDLLPDNCDAPIVRCVEFQNSLPIEVDPKQVFGESENRRSLACARGSIHKQVRNLASLHTVF